MKSYDFVGEKKTRNIELTKEIADCRINDEVNVRIPILIRYMMDRNLINSTCVCGRFSSLDTEKTINVPL